jgi:hypothetical protein
MTLALGTEIVPFSLPGVDGAEHGPRPGRRTIVAMWCNHCPYVQAWESRFDALVRANPGVDAIAINANDPVSHPGDGFEAMRERASARGFGFAYVQDESQETARAYGGERTPEIFLFDEDGHLRYHGAIDDSWEEHAVSQRYLEDALAALDAGRDPEPAETMPVGCTVKYRG